MNSARRTGVFLAALMVTVSASAAVSSAAQAAYTCHELEFCIYENAGYTGSVYVATESDIVAGKLRNLAGKSFTNGDPLDNAASSVRNLTTSAFLLGRNTPCKDLFQVISANTSISNLADVPQESVAFPAGNFDNKLSTVC